MPKAKWGSGDEALTAADIDNAQSSTFTPYSGPIPSSGLYRFVVSKMTKGKSEAGNDKLQTIMLLDGTWKSEHKKYNDCPLFDNMPVMKSTAFRTKAFCAAFGISAKEFLTGIIYDEGGRVTKLAGAGEPEGLVVYVNVKYVKASQGYAEKIQLNGTGYLPVDFDPDEAQSGDDTDAGDDDPGEEPPF
jgi:hypothetical protein